MSLHRPHVHVPHVHRPTRRHAQEAWTYVIMLALFAIAAVLGIGGQS